MTKENGMEIKLKLKTKDVEIELTEKEARELLDRLASLMIAKEYYPQWVWPPHPPWYLQPYYTSGYWQLGDDITITTTATSDEG